MLFSPYSQAAPLPAMATPPSPDRHGDRRDSEPETHAAATARFSAWYNMTPLPREAFEALTYALEHGDVASWEHVSHVAGRMARSHPTAVAGFDATAVVRTRVVLTGGALLQHACNLVESSGGADANAWLLLAVAATREGEYARTRGVLLLTGETEAAPAHRLDPRFRHLGGGGGVFYPVYERILTGSDRELIRRALGV